MPDHKLTRTTDGNENLICWVCGHMPSIGESIEGCEEPKGLFTHKWLHGQEVFSIWKYVKRTRAEKAKELRAARKAKKVLTTS